MFCSKCGAKNDDGTLFCSKCGARLNTQGESAESAQSENDIDEFGDTIKISPVKEARMIKDAPMSERIPQNGMHRENRNVQKPRPSAARAVRISDTDSDKPRSGTGDRSNSGDDKMKIAVIVLSVILAIVLITAVVFAVKLSSQNKSADDKPESSTTQTDKTEKKKDTSAKKEKKETSDDKDSDAEDNEKPVTPESYSTIPVDMSYASSEYSGEDGSHPASNAVDSKLSTAWAPSVDSGAGENITLCFSVNRTVHGIKIANGFSASEDEYMSHSRVRQITIKFPDGKTVTSVLNDGVLSMQKITFDTAVSCQSLTISIDSVYSSEDGSVPGISEIEVF